MRASIRAAAGYRVFPAVVLLIAKASTYATNLSVYRSHPD
jgi:hypothetical protein